MSNQPPKSRLLVILPLLFLLVTPELALAQCPAKATDGTKLPQPTLFAPAADDTEVVGKVPGYTAGSIVVCIDAQKAETVDVNKDGTFTVSGLKKGQTLVVQLSNGTDSGPQSNSVTMGDSSTLILIGGVEQATYSSLSQNTTAFLNAFIEGPGKNITGWGRVRLLGAPQPSTQGIVSTFTDPTGQLTTQDYSKVGQSLDFVIGPRFKIVDHWAFIADVGATTPLSSQTVAITYVAPAPGTVECTTLTNRFTPKNGYNPGLTMAPAGSTTCLAGGYTDVSFSNQDRSSFLLKYGAGFRTSNRFCLPGISCSPYQAVLDLTLGQDEAITRGLLRHPVLRLDGFLPLPTGNSSSYIYLFGSASIRLAKNQNLSPLILKQETATVTIPSPTVIVLPLQQPDRDFYRIGVGLNINQIFCKMFNTTCSQSNKSQSGGAAPQKTL